MMHPLPATWPAVNLCRINSMASQLENPKLKEEKYTDDIYGSYVRWPMLAGAIPFPTRRTGSLAALPAPRTPVVPRRGWVFLPTCNLWFFLCLAVFPTALAVTCGNRKAPVYAGGCLHSPCVDKRSQRADPPAPAHSLPFSTFPLHKD